MGTHPIFESDFDCLTDFRMEVDTQPQAQITKAEKKSSERQKKLLALNAADQGEYAKKVKKLRKSGVNKQKSRARCTVCWPLTCSVLRAFAEKVLRAVWTYYSTQTFQIKADRKKQRLRIFRIRRCQECTNRRQDYGQILVPRAIARLQGDGQNKGPRAFVEGSQYEVYAWIMPQSKSSETVRRKDACEFETNCSATKEQG